MTNDPLQYSMEKLLQSQREFQHELGHRFGEMSVPERVEYARTMVLALQAELFEFLNELSWKPWAEGERFNEQAAMKELVDAWHFFMNLLIITRPDRPSASIVHEFQTRYLQKLEINKQRQEQGYDSVTSKCPHCSRALDDVGTLQTLSGFVEGSGYMCGACKGALDSEQLIAAGVISAR